MLQSSLVKYRRSQSTILLACVNPCYYYSQSTKYWVFKRFSTTNISLFFPFPYTKGISHSPHLACFRTRSPGQAPEKTCAVTRYGSRRSKTGKQRSPSKGAVSGEVPGGGSQECKLCLRTIPAPVGDWAELHQGKKFQVP